MSCRDWCGAAWFSSPSNCCYISDCGSLEGPTSTSLQRLRPQDSCQTARCQRLPVASRTNNRRDLALATWNRLQLAVWQLSLDLLLRLTPGIVLSAHIGHPMLRIDLDLRHLRRKLFLIDEAIAEIPDLDRQHRPLRLS